MSAVHILPALASAFGADILPDSISIRAAIRSFRTKAESHGYPKFWIDEKADLIVQDCHRVRGKLESPIEQAILPWLCIADFHYPKDPTPARVHLTEEGPRPRGEIVIVPQFRFLQYRLDFAVICKKSENRWLWLAVECDGKEFHQDKEKDAERDRFLASYGIYTVRVSGADIYRNAIRAADQVAYHAASWWAHNAD